MGRGRTVAVGPATWAEREHLAPAHPSAAGRKGQRERRIQLLDEVVGVPVVLREEAQGDCRDQVVAPGAVQAAEEVLALLRGKRREPLTEPPLLPTRGPRRA